MKDLSNLSPAKGSNKTTKRLGRGIGSGLGKTAGKGHKGQRARKSGNVRAGFEGGQTPMYRRIPKFGFTNAKNMVRYHVINLEQLAGFSDGQVVDHSTLVEAGVLKKIKYPVKLLAKGEINKKLTVKLDKLSAEAKKAVETAGGQCIA